MFPRPVFVVDAVRTPIGRYKGALAEVRPDDLAAHVLSAVLDRKANGSLLRLVSMAQGMAAKPDIVLELTLPNGATPQLRIAEGQSGTVDIPTRSAPISRR